MDASTNGNLTWLDAVVFGAYFLIVIGTGLWVSRKPKDHERSSEDFFLAGRALPWWIIGTSLIASNISAEQMIGMTGSAFASGIAIVSYEWMAAVTLLLVAIFFLPVFLRMRIYSMPQYLEQRFDYRVSIGLGVFWLLVYVFVNLTSVTYLGALTLKTMIGLDLFYGVPLLVMISAIFTLTGGLTAVAWTDIIQVTVLFVGGVAVTTFGLQAMAADGGVVAGFSQLLNEHPDRFHTVLPWNHETLPWIGVFFGGMWVANFSYWGFNQYITQRALAARDLKHAQLGMAFAAFLKMIVPIVVVVPGVIAYALYRDVVPKADMAYPTLIREIVPAGFTGLILAALIAAIVSSLNSMTNSSATIFTMDIYRKLNPAASERQLVRTGRIVSAVVLLIAVFMAPMLSNLEEVFQYIQEYTGMVSPGVVAIFLYGVFWKRCTSAAALTMAIVTIPLSAGLKFLPLAFDPESVIAQFMNPFLNRMGVAFILLMLVGYVVSMMTQHATQEAPRAAGEEAGFEWPSMAFWVASLFIVGGLTALYLTFW